MPCSGKFDGILGLSFPKLSAAQSYTPVFDSIINQKLLDKNVFAFYYAKLPHVKSALEFGEPSPKYFEGEVEYVEVSKPLYWEMNLKDILVGGNSVGVCPSGNCKIVVDTGTSLLTGPTTTLAQVTQLINVAEDCSNFEQLPTLTYILSDSAGDHEFDLEPNYYIIKQNDGGVGSGGGSCKPGFMALDVNPPRGPLWILGDTFMQKFFTVFSRQPPSVGFAVAKHPPAA